MGKPALLFLSRDSYHWSLVLTNNNEKSLETELRTKVLGAFNSKWFSSTGFLLELWSLFCPELNYLARLVFLSHGRTLMSTCSQKRCFSPNFSWFLWSFAKSVSFHCVTGQLFVSFCLDRFYLLFDSVGASNIRTFFLSWKLLTCMGNNEFFIVQLLRFFYIT